MEPKIDNMTSSGINNGHEFIDLGLSVKWATCNVGASTPEGHGDYYAWGEKESKNTYNWSTYKWSKGSHKRLTKYNTMNYYGLVDNKTTLEHEDDIAHIKWGNNWRMPTKAEIDELIHYCTWTWTSVNGINGYRVTSNIEGYTNRAIFLPASGFFYDTELKNNGSWGLYLSSTLGKSDTDQAWHIAFISNCIINSEDSEGLGRSLGRSVRPVFPSNEWSAHATISLDNDHLILKSKIDYRLYARVMYKGKEYDYSNDGFMWTSDNQAVAIVNQKGDVTPVSNGIARITVSLGLLTAKCVITVI